MVNKSVIRYNDFYLNQIHFQFHNDYKIKANFSFRLSRIKSFTRYVGDRFYENGVLCSSNQNKDSRSKLNETAKRLMLVC